MYAYIDCMYDTWLLHEEWTDEQSDRIWEKSNNNEKAVEKAKISKTILKKNFQYGLASAIISCKSSGDGASNRDWRNKKILVNRIPV